MRATSPKTHPIFLKDRLPRQNRVEDLTINLAQGAIALVAFTRFPTSESGLTVSIQVLTKKSGILTKRILVYEEWDLVFANQYSFVKTSTQFLIKGTHF